MAKNSVSDWDSTAANNTDIGGITLVGTVMQVKQVDNAFREMMAQIKTFSTALATSSVTISGTAPIITLTDTDTGSDCIISGSSASGSLSFSADTNNEVASSQIVFNVDGAGVAVMQTGRMGIGTTSPQKPFVVSNAGAQGYEISPNDSGFGVRTLAYNRSTAAYVTHQTEALSFTWALETALAMTLNSTALTPAVPIRGNDGSNAAPAFSFNNDGNTGVYRIASDVLGFTAGGAAIANMTTSGLNVTGTVTCVDLVETSDISLKHDIRPLNNAREIVSSIEANAFSWLGSEEEEWGFIADKFEEIAPQVVKVGEDGIKRIRPTAILALLWNTVREKL